MKINVDFAVSRNGEYGAVEAICRVQDGMFIGASTLFFPCMVDPPTLEALATREAMALAEDTYSSWPRIARQWLILLGVVVRPLWRCD